MSVLRRFEAFEQAFVDALHFATALSVDWMMRAIPALFEWVFDDSPPAGGAQVCYGHDHAGSGSDPAGIAIPRNGIVTGAHGAGSSPMWSVVLTKGAGYSPADADQAAPRSDTVLAGGLNYMIQGYIDPDLDTDLSAGLYVEAWIALYIAEALGDVNVKVVNQTAGLVAGPDSAITHMDQAQLIQWVKVTDIPVRGGMWNQFNIELEAGGTLEDPITVSVYGYSFAEIYLGGSLTSTAYAAPLSQPPQTGDPA